MKKGYSRLLTFEVLIFLFLILNSFVWNILSGYKMLLFLVILLVAFKLLFGFEKDKHRYVEDIILDTVIYLIIFFIIFYLLGIFISFAKVENYYNFYGLKTFILPIIISTVLKEILRYMFMSKSEGNKLLYITTCLMFIFIEVTVALAIVDFSSKYKTFLFVAITLLPAITNSIVNCYLTLKIGYKPIIFFVLVVSLYRYLFPIIPNPDEYLTSIVQLLLPIGFLYRTHKFLSKDYDEFITRDYNKRLLGAYVVPVLLTIGLVYITSGYFHYYAIAIASGSMEPNISRGDVVIIEKLDEQYDKLEVGQVIAYRYEGIIVVHRLVNIIKDNGKYYFYSRGDSNESDDNWVITEDMIIGTVDHKIPFVGLPTVWLNEL